SGPRDAQLGGTRGIVAADRGPQPGLDPAPHRRTAAREHEAAEAGTPARAELEPAGGQRRADRESRTGAVDLAGVRAVPQARAAGVGEALDAVERAEQRAGGAGTGTHVGARGEADATALERAVGERDGRRAERGLGDDREADI